jgi:outer membrane protein assembly factor BamB
VAGCAAVGYGNIFFGNAGAKVYGVDIKTGQERWRTEVGGPISSSPTLTDSHLLYIGSADRCLYVLDVESGVERWKFKTEGAVNSAAVVHGEVVFFGSDDGHLYAVA